MSERILPWIVEILLMSLASLTPATTAFSQTTIDNCRSQVDAALDGTAPAIHPRAGVADLKLALRNRPYHEAYLAGVELLRQPEFADGTSLGEVLGILGRPDLTFVGTDDGAQLFYNTNGGPLDLSFQRCRLIHKSMNTPGRWRGTDVELAALWSKARHSREWWNWYPMTGTISRVGREAADGNRNSEMEVDLAGGIYGTTGTLSFRLAPKVMCRGQWSATPGNSAVVTRGRLLTEYGPKYFPGSAGPSVKDFSSSLGHAYIDCDGGRTIRLEFITGPGSAHGWGIGQDNEGAIYQFTF